MNCFDQQEHCRRGAVWLLWWITGSLTVSAWPLRTLLWGKPAHVRIWPPWYPYTVSKICWWISLKKKSLDIPPGHFLRVIMPLVWQSTTPMFCWDSLLQLRTKTRSSVGEWGCKKGWQFPSLFQPALHTSSPEGIEKSSRLEIYFPERAWDKQVHSMCERWVAGDILSWRL